MVILIKYFSVTGVLSMFLLRQFPQRLNSIFLILMVMIFSIGLTACSDKDNAPTKTLKSVKIAVSTTPLSAPFYVAKDQGYFKEQGLDVELIDTVGGHRCLQSILDKKVVMGTVSDYPIMLKSFQRQDYVVVTTFVTATNDVKLIANKSKGINSPSDLKGKTVGTVIGASSHFFLDQFLIFNGMSLADVNVIHLKADDMPAALKNGTVDALSVWEPYGFLSVNKLHENAIVFPSKNYYRETFNLVADRKYTTEHPETVVAVLSSLSKAENFINEQPKAAQNILIKNLQLDEKFIGWIWPDFKFDLSLDQAFIKTLETEAAWAVANNVTTKPNTQNFLDFIYFDALNTVDKTAVTIIH